MSLTSSEMKLLEDDARAIASKQGRSYLADARQCLRETSDPIAAIELLRAMWGGGHAKRNAQKAALQDAGRWLHDRVRRQPDVSVLRLELELGWLHRLISIHAKGDDDIDDDRWRPPREPPFGGYLPELRRKREAALAHRARDAAPAPNTAPPQPSRLDRLPDAFEVCFASPQDAAQAFRDARNRKKKNKAPKPRDLVLRPIRPELQHLTTDLVACTVATQGIDALQASAADASGVLPNFWIAVADLIPRDGKRLAQRISLRAADAAGGQAPSTHVADDKE
jgi:hypothetical protein